MKLKDFLTLKVGSGVLVSGTRYSPLINYDWSTTTTKEYKTNGVELVTNGGFDIDVSGWLTSSGGAHTWNSGRLEIRRDGSDNGFPKALQKLSLEANSLYLVKATCISSTTGAYEVYMDTVREGGTTTQSQVPIGTEIVRYITVTSSTGIMLSGAGFSLSNTDDVVVFDNISVQKVVEEPNKRYLKDVGSTPTYNASMYFGRGAAFNGVDQSISVPVSVNRAQGTSVCIVISDSSIANLGYVAVSNTSTAHIVQYNGAYGIYDVPTGYYKALFTPTKNTHHICVTQVGSVGKMYVDGVFIRQTTLSNSSNPPAISIMGTQFGFVSGLLKDLFYFNKPLTQEEITQAYEQPEAFYAMAQGDSTCLLNMPMCETDGYVRNMKSYGVGSELDTSFVPNNYTPSAVTARIAQFNLGLVVEANKTYLVEIEYDDTTNSILTGYASYGAKGDGTHSSFHTGLKGIVKGTKGTAFYLLQMPSTYLGLNSTTAYAWITTTAAGQTAYISVRSLKEVTGIYPITNYTASVIDNAKNLQYGLQTCKFKRDSLGVIQSASNYLECDGVGYGNTGWGSIASEEKTIEYIVEKLLRIPTVFESIVTDGKAESKLYSRFNINKTNSIGTNIGGNGYTEVTFNNVVHITIVLKTNGYELFKDGVSQGFKNATGSIPRLTDVLIGTDANRIKTLSSPIRLLKVHSKALTQAEITANYNSYVAKGLLS